MKRAAQVVYRDLHSSFWIKLYFVDEVKVEVY